MDMIESVKIENFRQFDKLKIDNCKRINFLVGQNNCGKTTLLEAIYLGSYPMNMNPLATTYNFRKMELIQDTVPMLFFRKNENESISINIETLKKSSYVLSMKLSEDNNQSKRYENRSQGNIAVKEYDYIATYNSNEYKCRFNVSIDLPTKIFFNVENEKNKAIEDFCIPTLYTCDMKSISPERFEIAINENREYELVKYLQIFDSRISGIGFGKDNKILVEIMEEDNSKYKLPLQLLGDGFIKFASILVDILYEKIYNNVILIDEIENGLHYTNIKQLIRAILTLSKEMNIQMFITTHSYETLKFLSEIANEEEFISQKDDIQVINIAKTKLKGFKSYCYSLEGML